MINEKVCKECPDGVRGYCCYLNTILGKHNVILENQPCPYLNLKIKLCSIYDEREKLAPHCFSAKDTIGKGGLPKGCLYLKGKEHLEPYPKVFIKDVIDDMKPLHIGIFNTVNNMKFEDFAQLREQEVKT